MAAAARLYNPFREQQQQQQQKAKEAAAATKVGQQESSFSSPFNFAFQTTTTKVSASASESSSSVDPFKRLDDFDPFRIATTTNTTTTTKSPTSVVGTNSTNNVIPEIKTVGSNVSNKSNKSTKSNSSVVKKVTPKLVVKLSTKEEVISRMKMAFDEFDMTSEVTVEGTVYAQVQCSDATKNAPFALLIPHQHQIDQQSFSVRPNEKYSVTIRGGGGGGNGNSSTTTSEEGAGASSYTTTNTNVPILVNNIPKSEIVAVPIAYYSMQREVKFMPVLVERKITRNGARVRIAIQIRSRLDNLGDMKDITILVAVPEKVNGDTVTIVRGENFGTWCPLKRTIKWKIPHLIKGQSELVTAEADLWKKPVSTTPVTTTTTTTILSCGGGRAGAGAGPEDETPFPVMFRCSSVADPITTSLEWKLAQVSGNPAHITVPSIAHNFRLLHRLP